MKKIHIGFLLVTICLLGALWFAPVYTVSAAEDDHAAETHGDESEVISPRGPGAVIIMIGLAAIGLVGLAYSTRTTEDANT
ncbi:MAG: hypothetical protein ACLFTK_06995 [Anaerolineales bacterium]